MLITLLAENIKNISGNMNNEGVNVSLLETKIVNDLELDNDEDFLTYAYVLVRQLEDLTAKYFVAKRDVNNK